MTFFTKGAQRTTATQRTKGAQRTTGTRPTSAARRRRPVNWGRIAAWAALAVAILVTVGPFLWMLRTALSNNHALATQSSNLLPADFTWGAFARVFGLQSQAQAQAEGGSGASINFWQYLLNSLIVSTMITVSQVFFSSLAAYAFARLRWRGRDKVFALFLGTLLVPSIFTALPNFLLVKNLGLLNTYLGIALPSMLMTPFAVFFLRQFFLGMSREVEEAAMLDGARHVRIFFQVVLPNAVAPLATLCLLTFIAAWNDYFWPLLVGNDPAVRVLTVGLGVFKSQSPQGAPDWSGLMAATLVSALPVLLLFVAFGKKIVNSIGFSGIK